MNCDDVRTMLAGYADGELSAVENDAVVAHLEQCGRCRQIVRDQQRVQHVLDSYDPPPVDEAAWTEMAKRLRTELEGKGDPIQLKTRARIEGLDATPEAMAPLAPEETRPAPPRPVVEVPAPTARARPAPGPTLSVVRVAARKARPRFRWVAHAMGAMAASLVLALGLATLWMRVAPPLKPSALARQSDVAIMEVQMLDANYNLILYAGDADDVAAIWVEPNESNG